MHCCINYAHTQCQHCSTHSKSRHRSCSYVTVTFLYVAGILIYEVLSGAYPVAHSSDGSSSELSNLPWYGMSFTAVFTAVVVQEERPQLHRDSVHDGNVLHAAALVDIMSQCVQGDPFYRPTFEQVVHMLQEHEQLYL
jgi:hypothetical protein